MPIPVNLAPLQDLGYSGMMDEEGLAPPKVERKATKKRRALALAALLVAAFALGAGGAQFFAAPGVTVPEGIARQVPFPIYLPQRLPGNFRVIKNSFSYRDGALIFAAKDDTGASITFAEQKKNPSFDLTNFYNKQLEETKTLSDVPFPSVTGRARTGQARILSILADETWLFISTAAPLGQENMQTIADGIEPAK